MTVNASNKVELIGTSADGRAISILSASAERGSTGNAGDLTISTQDLLVRNGAQVLSSTFRVGKGGNLTVNASNKVELIGTSANGTSSSLGTSTQQDSIENGGDLTITTQDLLVRDGAQVSTATFGMGKGGNLAVNASNKVELIGTSADGRAISILNASAQAGSTGNAGDLTITTQDLLMGNGAQVFTGTYGTGKGGSLTVNASDKVELIGTSADGRIRSALSTSAQAGLTENAGNLTITTQDLLVQDGAQVNAGTYRSEISTTASTAQAGGNGSNITINTCFFIAVPDEKMFFLTYTENG
ncbi:hypothetical protein NUACC26_059480 [Scytonema sp. NUACC26]